MGVAEWFNVFFFNLQVQNDGSISQRYRAITRRLNTDFWNTTSETSHSLYVGSYGRNTAIEGFSDLDMVFELPSAVYHQHNQHIGNGQSALLQTVRNSIRRTYSASDVGADGQVVLVSFVGMAVEVVPVFVNTAGSYTLPDSNGGGRWNTTNPRPEIVAIRDRNASCNLNLVPLCRMMRAWKREWSVPIGGLLIDTLAYQFISNWIYREKSFLYYDFMCRDFLEYMANQDQNQLHWKAPGSGQHVYTKGPFQHKAKRCHNISLDAISCASSGKEWSARQRWREIFGTAFPD
jgi:hypothetical protein